MGNRIIDEQIKHPSYGMASFNRISGHANFFGSHMTSHNWVELKVKGASVSHDLGKNWYFSDKHLVSVRLTNNQFVDLITNMNTGGVPCTIERVLGERVEALPKDEKTEAQKAVYAFKERMCKFSERLEDDLNTVNKLTSKARINKSDAKQLQAILTDVLQEVKSNVPWFGEQFDKSASKIVTQAKQEVEAFTSDIIRQAGLEAIAKGNMPTLAISNSED